MNSFNETITEPKGSNLKPKKRTRIRLHFGKIYYTLARWLKWQKEYKKIARHKSDIFFKNECFTHSTPLFRQLKNVDMWMQENKVVNLKIACEKINGIIINPGEKFSYWKTIGNPTKRKGYKEGMILYYGKLKPGIGGGLCQLSNMLFWMALHSPLTISERYRHSYDVFPDVNRKLPFGSGATCVYNYKDLQLTNNTKNPIQISVQITDNMLKGKILTKDKTSVRYEVYEKEHIINHHFWGGYTRHNVLYRRVFQNNKLTGDEYLFENHALMMYQPFIENKTNKQ